MVLRQAAAIEQSLHFVQGHVARRLVARIRRNVGHDSPAIFAERYDSDQAIVTEEKVDAIPGQGRLQLHVGEDETLVVLRAFEIHVESMARRAVGAVATNDPRRFYRLFAPIGVTQNGAHGVACLGQARQLDPALHGDPERVEMFAEQTLGFGLRQSQSERERARDGSELDSGDLLETMMKGEPVAVDGRLR